MFFVYVYVLGDVCVFRVCVCVFWGTCVFLGVCKCLGCVCVFQPHPTHTYTSHLITLSPYTPYISHHPRPTHQISTKPDTYLLPHPTSPYLTLPHPISPYLTLPHPISPYLTLSHPIHSVSSAMMRHPPRRPRRMKCGCTLIRSSVRWLSGC